MVLRQCEQVGKDTSLLKKIKIGVSHYGSMEGGNRRKTAASALNIERSCCKIDIQT